MDVVSQPSDIQNDNKYKISVINLYEFFIKNKQLTGNTRSCEHPCNLQSKTCVQNKGRRTEVTSKL